LPSAGTAKVTVETKNDSGVTFNASGRRSIKGKDTVVDGTFEPTWDWSAQNLELKSNLSTNNTFTHTLTFKDLGSKGSKLSAVAAQTDKGYQAGAGASFKNDVFTFKFNGTYPQNKEVGGKADLTLTAAFEKKAHAGASVSYTLGTEKSAAALLWGLKLGYDQPEFQGVVDVRTASKDKKDQLIVGATWFHKINESLKLALAAAFDTKQVAGPSVTVGSEYKFDALTSLKTKVGFQAHTDASKQADVRLSVGLKQLITKNAAATFGADLNARHLAGQHAGEDHAFGVEVKFS